ncbi:hypothetical protein [Azospirillum rugosum]|nr:hypothetical protein [Azospirillum rugosum]
MRDAFQAAALSAAPSVLGLYRQWRHAIRQGARFARIGEDLEEAMDTPWPLVCMPSYAGGGIVEGLYRIDQEERLLDIDRERLTAEYREKWAAYQAAKEACGAEAAHAESVRWEREASTLAAQIMTTPARTLEEMHAKTAVGLRFADAKASCEDPDGALQSLRRDIGRALRGQRRGRNGADGSPVEQRVADLVRLRDEFEQLWEADEGSAECAACGFAIDAEVKAIYGAPINTMADAAAVLRGVLIQGADEMNRSDVPVLERLSAFLDAQAARGAVLQDLEARLHELSAAYDALPADAPRRAWRPLWRAMRRVERQIADTPATDLEGLAVKLRLALGPHGTGAGQEPEQLLHGALADLERMITSRRKENGSSDLKRQ